MGSIKLSLQVLSYHTFVQKFNGPVDQVVGVATRVCSREFLAKVGNGQCVPPAASPIVIVVLLTGAVGLHIFCLAIHVFAGINEEPVRSFANFFDRVEGTVQYDIISRSVLQLSRWRNVLEYLSHLLSITHCTIT